MCLSPPGDALAWLDQCIEEAQESLMALSDALASLSACSGPDEVPGGKLPPETEHILLAEERRCLLAAALIRRLERRVRPQIARLREPYLTPGTPVELGQGEHCARQKDLRSTCCLNV
jgi:hypothetical protein